MDHTDSGQMAKAKAPEPIIMRAIKRLVGNVDAINGQIKALEEKLAPAMREADTSPDEKERGVEGHMGVPVAMELQKMSVSLENYYKRLDDLLQRIEL